MLLDLQIDCLAVVERHVAHGDYEPDKFATQHNCPNLKIKGYNSASKHRDSTSGGVAWYWKNNLNVEIWEGAPLHEDLKEAGRERCWIKIHCQPKPIALSATYMPTETNNDSNGGKYQKILDVLTLDCNKLKEEGVTDFLFGDFNAHVGTPAEHPLGIKGNKPKIGHNGHRLLLWL